MTEVHKHVSIDISAGAGIQTWKMNFVPVNQLNAATLAVLADAVKKTADDPSIAVVVLTSAIRVFSAGADASEMAAMAAQHGVGGGLVDQFNKTMDMFRELCIAIRRSPFLMIAALNGHTLAGGLELAAACDLQFAADSDKIQIGVPEMDLFGAVPSGGGAPNSWPVLWVQAERCNSSSMPSRLLLRLPIRPVWSTDFVRRNLFLPRLRRSLLRSPRKPAVLASPRRNPRS